MSLLMTNDKKEIIITCNCGCESSFHIRIDPDEEYDYYGFLCFMKGNFETECAFGLWPALKIKLKKIWCIVRNKDYYYSDTIMSKSDFEEFKGYITQFE